MAQPWHLTISPLGDHTVVCLHGNLDLSNAGQVAIELRAAIAASSGSGGVIIDLAGLDFCDASGLRVMITAAALARTRHSRLEFCAATGPVARVLALTHLDRGLPVHPDLDTAARNLHAPQPPSSPLPQQSHRSA